MAASSQEPPSAALTRACDAALELIGRVEADRARGACDEAEAALRALAALPDVTLAVLSRTKVGVRVARLRDDAHAGLAEAARETV
jgi:predicted DCC family thiol-disulfide oxidoreductase YuxK